VAEFGHTADLLNNPASRFAIMAKASGITAAFITAP
jgi:hypothetical protein